MLSHSDNVEASGFVQHLKLPHYVDFQSELELVRAAARRRARRAIDEATMKRGRMTMPDGGYNFAYLDEQTKRMIRRALLKAVAIPGYQVPFGAREMPLPYGWGTGGIQVTAAIIGRDDTLKVIDQGADDTTNAVSIRRFFARTTGVATTDAHRGGDASSRPATAFRRRRCSEGQILVYQVPIPEPLRWLEPRETETRKMHALAEYGADAGQALRGHRPPRPHRHDLRLSGDGQRPLSDGAVADPEVRQSEDGHAIRRCSCSAPAARSASTPCRPTRR